MIWILGASGYIGEAFVAEAKRRKLDYRPVCRKELDYTDFRTFLIALQKEKPDFVINAAGFTGKPNVDTCEKFKAETIAGNIALALTVAQASDVAGIRLGTVSSGCIYTGAKIRKPNGQWVVEDRLTDPLIIELLEQRSERVEGFTEDDQPNFCFEKNNCSFYSGTKAVAENALKNFPDFYIWRLRIPFDEFDSPRNYLRKILNYPKIYQNWNSLSHRGEFASACFNCLLNSLSGGVYNLTNSGYTSTQEVVKLIQKLKRPKWKPKYWENDDEFYRFGATARRSNCILNTKKAIQSGLGLRNVKDALIESLEQWKN